MQENDNLDLDNYKPFMHDFQKFSVSVFDFGDSGIFKLKDETAHDIIKQRLTLTKKQTER